MNVTEDDLDKVREKLYTYKGKVEAGNELDREEDYLELDVSKGRIWLHPQEDGTTVDIYLFDDTEDYDFMPARVRIMNFLSEELGFYDPHTPFLGSDRMTIRIDFSEL